MRGQAGNDNSASLKKLKAGQQDDEMSVSDGEQDAADDKNLTIAERLQMLTDALDEEEEDEDEDDEDGDAGVTAAIAAADTTIRARIANTRCADVFAPHIAQQRSTSGVELYACSS